MQQNALEKKMDQTDLTTESQGRNDQSLCHREPFYCLIFQWIHLLLCQFAWGNIADIP